MFGNAYFGQTYYGDTYFGPAGSLIIDISEEEVHGNWKDGSEYTKLSQDEKDMIEILTMLAGVDELF